MKIYKFIPFFILIFSVVVFFYPFFLQGKLPIPSDTIVGLYHPFRDLYAESNPRGVPYKNFLITDPVRQQYPWKNLVVNFEKQLQVPLWNPYEMAGTPLLANFQSSPFYPLNLLLFIPPFSISWSFFILLQPLLAGIFLYLYLKHLNLDSRAALLGSLTWMFCGFSIAWLEWGVVLHTALWLPLVLLSIDKHVSSSMYHVVSISAKILWSTIYLFAITSGFFAGHLQTFFYLFIFSFSYFLARLYQIKHNKILIFILYILLNTLFIILTLPQSAPTLQFILLSNRVSDQIFTNPGWFIPYQNLAQFIAPDFFGNPATLNYFGVWNYGEFIGYIGIGSLILALYALCFRRDRKTLFFVLALLLALVLSLQNLISQVPFFLQIPFLSTAQPTRLLFIISFCLSVLTAFGLDLFIRSRKNIWVPIITVGIILVGLWIFVFVGKQFFLNEENLLVSINNLKFPSILFAGAAILLIGFKHIHKSNVKTGIMILFFALVIFDLFRFGWKFTSFTDSKYLFPQTRIIDFLQKQEGIFRIAATDSRILPPNFSVMYKLQSIEGYDPLYLKSYAEFIAANERTDHSIKPPFGFNRIITPRNFDSQAIDFLNVKYVLSLSDLSNPKFKKVFQEGETRVYENLKLLPRVFFVENVQLLKNRDNIAKSLFEVDLSSTAIVEKNVNQDTFSIGRAEISDYTSNKIEINTENLGLGFLVLSDVYYPAFHATIDGKEAEIMQVNLAFRGIIVPAGKHTVIFEAKLF